MDPILQASDILCFSETWLSPHQQVQFLKVDHSTFRCDRNEQNTKGGVLTSVSKILQPLQHQSFTNGKFESLTVLLILSPTIMLSITNIYRSPTLNFREFINKLESIISPNNYACRNTW